MKKILSIIAFYSLVMFQLAYGQPISGSGGTFTGGTVSGATTFQQLVSFSPQSVTCTDSGDGSPGTLTITPTASDIKLTVSDANGCTITMGEVGAVEGTIVVITNISAANTATFTTSANVLTLKRGSPYVMGAKESLVLIYKGAEWLEIGRTGAEQLLIMDDAAQFGNVADPTKKVKVDPSGMTTGKTLTLKGTFDQSATINFSNTGLSADSKEITFTFNASDSRNYTFPDSDATLGSAAFSQCKTITNPAENDWLLFHILKSAITATKVRGICVGGTSVNVDVQECTSAGATCALDGTGDIQTATLTVDTDGASTTDFADASLAADAVLKIRIGTVTGVVTQVMVCLEGT